MATDTTDPSAPGRPGISVEQAREAVDTWVARTGRLPTTRQLRTALGDTGSLSTLGRHLQTIKAERLIDGEQPAPQSSEALLIKAVNAALKELSSEAADAADALVRDAEREAETRVQAALSLQHQAEARVVEVEKSLERAAGLADGQQQRIEQLRADLDNLRGERNQVQTELTEIRETKQTLQLTVERLRAENDSVVNELAELRHQRDALSETVDRLESDRTTLRDERDQLTQDLGSQQQALAITELQLQTERETTARLAQEDQSHRHEHQELLARVEQQGRAFASAQEQLAAVRAQLSGAISETTALKEERDRLLREIELRWNKLPHDSSDDAPRAGLSGRSELTQSAD